YPFADFVPRFLTISLYCVGERVQVLLVQTSMAQGFIESLAVTDGYDSLVLRGVHIRLTECNGCVAPCVLEYDALDFTFSLIGLYFTKVRVRSPEFIFDLKCHVERPVANRIQHLCDGAHRYFLPSGMTNESPLHQLFLIVADHVWVPIEGQKTTGGLGIPLF